MSAALAPRAWLPVQGGQQESDLGRQTGPSFLLECPAPQHSLEGKPGVLDPLALLPGFVVEKDLMVPLEDGFPVRNESPVQDESGNDEEALGALGQVSHRAHLYLDVTRLGDIGIGGIEGSVGDRLRRPREGGQKQQHDFSAVRRRGGQMESPRRRGWRAGSRGNGRTPGGMFGSCNRCAR